MSHYLPGHFHYYFKLLFTLLCLGGLLASACITVDKHGNPIDMLDEEPGAYELKKVKIRPVYKPDDKKVPFVLAGVRDGAPDVFRVPGLPKVGNQSRQRSGTAWAAGYTAFTVLIKKRQKINYTCSPSFVYNQLNTGNKGISIIGAVQLLKQVGCSDISLMPYRSLDFSTRPSEKAFNNARKYVAEGFGRVDFTDVNQVKAHLLQGSVIIATIRVTRNFIELKKELWKQPAGYFRGMHTIAVVGYDEKNRQFIIMNSAGKSWGDDGFAKIPYDWFIRVAAQAYVVW